MPLWKSLSGSDPAAPHRHYDEYDAARLRALVYNNLKEPHKFVLMCDDYFFDRINHLQSSFGESTAYFMEPDRDVELTPEQELIEGPPYVAVRRSPLNWLYGVELLRKEPVDASRQSGVLDCFAHKPRPGSRCVLLGLNNIPTGDLSWLFSWNTGPVGLISVTPGSGYPCKALVTYDQEGAGIVYSEYLKAIKFPTSSSYISKGRIDEIFLLKSLAKRYNWAQIEEGTPEKVFSYKGHIRPKVTSGANVSLAKSSLVYFDGMPKPSDLDKSSVLGRLWNSV